ncbi:MAG: 8-oxo-dGTP diphosphatase MutT, partial [Clostridium sp.]|nr:8-oxo-dGTP diphosphatase MutT [Clostridium sp.]
DNTHEYENIIVNLITVKCKLIEGIPTASEHSKLIWLKRENLDSLKWAPTDIPAVEELKKEKV